MAGHPGEGDLEQYTMSTCPEGRAEEIEEHLLLCEECRARLAAIDRCLLTFREAAVETLDDLHYRHKLRDGWADITVSRSGSRWTARIWAPDVEFDRLLETFEEAFACSRNTFLELFPEHGCGPECGPAAGSRKS
jgi:hypothetical protein